jgi:adenylate cyclase
MSLFSIAVSRYVNKDWTRARNRFGSLLQAKPGDRASQIFIERCGEYEINPPKEDWAGEYVYTT